MGNKSFQIRMYYSKIFVTSPDNLSFIRQEYAEFIISDFKGRRFYTQLRKIIYKRLYGLKLVYCNKFCANRICNRIFCLIYKIYIFREKQCGSKDKSFFIHQETVRRISKIRSTDTI